ncbi:SH3 domain-containing protein [Streptomyces sp. NPDC050844]|uniref:SH3 domain-containing protein n=1 Tax=Streptomyces sp. NPDC050844 TaxID=3155790 RepID=UPI0033EDB757
MRTTPAVLGTLAAALLTGGSLALGGASPASATTADGDNHNRHHAVIWGKVVSPGDLKVRDAPSTGATIVDRLSSGSQDRVECQTRGTSVFGNTWWYWLGGAQGWASAEYIDVGGRHVPRCAVPPDDPCPQHKPCCDPCPDGCNRYH